ncbi:tellurite resistance TerB family protein [Halomonas mongoliensis]|uniref:tellurite resistance TerB family protein n=1 Tax=Halomonas mongoliensis TaxID=321265 RepID=UPI00403A8CD6
MLVGIQRFFQQVLAEPEHQAPEAPTLELAVAALLCEVMRADYQEDPAQLTALREMLSRQLAVQEEAVDELVALAREEAENAVDHYQFVSLLTILLSLKEEDSRVVAFPVPASRPVAFGDGTVGLIQAPQA